ncbi:MAG: hypothetical protein Q9211_001700 [Gyalolechia sp. 1 TL-2023]
MPTGTQVKGSHGDYLITKQLHRNVWHAIEKQTMQPVIVKSAPDFFLRNERDILNRFHALPSLRHFIDEIQDPHLLVLEYLETNLLIESGMQKLESSEVKHVTKAILRALTALHEEGIVHTDIKPDNLLANRGKSGKRFEDIRLADCGDCTHMDTVVEEHIIGATIFRSPEAMLNLIWGPATDIWSLGATARMISLLWGEHWHIFKPRNVDPTDPAYPMEVMRRQHQYFGPFPLSYTNLVDDETLGTLTFIMESVEKRTPFSRASSKEISREDRDFVCKLMRLDPRDRPSAKGLLQDPWLTGSTADFN